MVLLKVTDKWTTYSAECSHWHCYSGILTWHHLQILNKNLIVLKECTAATKSQWLLSSTTKTAAKASCSGFPWVTSCCYLTNFQVDFLSSLLTLLCKLFQTYAGKCISLHVSLKMLSRLDTVASISLVIRILYTRWCYHTGYWSSAPWPLWLNNGFQI